MNEIINVLYIFISEKILFDSQVNLKNMLLNSLKMIGICDKLDDKHNKIVYTPLKTFVQTILDYLNSNNIHAALVG